MIEATVYDKFSALPQGTYQITEGFPNPLHKKSAKYGIKGRADIKTGATFKITRRAESLNLGTLITWDKVTLVGVLFATAQEGVPGSASRVHPVDLGTLSEVRLFKFLELFVSNCEKCPDTLGDVVNATLDRVDTGAIIAMLFSQGKVTAEDIIESGEAVNDMSGDEYRAFTKKYGVSL
jgi:hypothetical protein